MTTLFREDGGSAVEDSKTPGFSPSAIVFVGFAGIILPIITLGVEVYSGMCATEFFNPVPTLWHFLLVAFVPIINSYLLYAALKERIDKPMVVAWASLFSIGVSLFYAIIFVPLIPLGLLGIIFAGIGFLPLSPILSFFAVALLRRHIIGRTGKTFPLSWLGMLTGLLFIIVTIALSENGLRATKEAIRQADSPDAVKQTAALKYLREQGNDFFLRSLNRSPYGRNLSIGEAVENFFSSNKNSERGNGRNLNNIEQVYYQLNGEILKPRLYRDSYVYSEPKLNLVSSQMDGSIDNNASLGYLEWTFTFRNNGGWQREASSDIILPPGGVVSRVNLWINGEEREAAYAENGRVTRAYREVTAKRRDPLLVTKSGKDRARMRAFPIEPNGGEMKIRIGITFPLILETESSGLIEFPKFFNHNFKIPNDTKHIIWFEIKINSNQVRI